MTRILLMVLLGLTTAGFSPSPTPGDRRTATGVLTLETPVNQFATVRSDEGYLNVRGAPDASEPNVLSEIPTGEHVLVVSCAEGMPGRRWCYVERVQSGYWSPELPEAAGGAGYVYDAELVYSDPLSRESDAHPPFALGGGVPRGFTAAYLSGQVEYTIDFASLNDRPSHSAAVIQRALVGYRVSTIACGPGGPMDRWCLAWVYGQGPSGDILRVDRVEDIFGYIHMSMVSVAGGVEPAGSQPEPPPRARTGSKTPINRIASIRSDDGAFYLRDEPGAQIDFWAAEHGYGRMPDGERVLVTHCEPGPRNDRWCFVERIGLSNPWSVETMQAYGPRGFVSEPSLSYAPPTRRNGADHAPSALGTGVPSGYVVTELSARVRSDDGYVNLREGPSSSEAVMRRLPNGSDLYTIACGPGATRARWCLVIAPASLVRGVTEYVDSYEQAIGYVYTAELAPTP